MTYSMMQRIAQYDAGQLDQLNTDDIRFIELLKADDRFFTDFVGIVKELQADGIERFRANLILGYLRYLHRRRYKGEKGPYALNDHHGPRMARLLIELDLVAEGFFELRDRD